MSLTFSLNIADGTITTFNGLVENIEKKIELIFLFTAVDAILKNDSKGILLHQRIQKTIMTFSFFYPVPIEY